MNHPHRPTVVCFGEALWDILPRGMFLGGAPLNAAYHLSRNGVQAIPVSAVGREFLGDEALRRVEAWGISTRFILRLRHRSTGTVRAKLDRTGTASYTITRAVAWDRVGLSRSLLNLPAPAAIVYGSLALREKENQRTLQRLFTAWPHALRVLDINLRRPFDQGSAVRLALAHAQFLKLNDDELGRLSTRRVRTAREIEYAVRRFAGEHHLERVCVTAGARGAGLLWEGRWHWEPGRAVVVKDTVGAGDAFLGALLAAIIARHTPPAAALTRACRLGEFVAARDGATPPYECNARGQPREPSP